MPLRYFREIWTPLRLLRIRVLREVYTGLLYVRFGTNKPRRIYPGRKLRQKIE